MRLFFLIIFLSTGLSLAGENDFSSQKLVSASPENTSPVQFNSEKFALLQEADEQVSQDLEMTASAKSGVKAAFLSALIPGAGEVYAKSYWRAAIFAGIEIALWSANISYENKGDKEDKKMRTFGDLHWSEQKYWTKVYEKAQSKDLWDGSDLTVENYLIADNQYNDPSVINQLRELEHQVGYTHSLPETKTQQYYEMIYKYLHQFGVGWDDVSALTGGDEASAWIYYDTGNLNLGNLSPNTEKYRSMRNRSNDYYQNATNMLNLALLNHIFSAFDAALAVKQFNKKVNYAVRANRQLHGNEYVTTYGLYLSW